MRITIKYVSYLATISKVTDFVTAVADFVLKKFMIVRLEKDAV